MYRFIPLKIGLVPAVPMPAILYMTGFGQTIPVAYHFWVLEGHGHRVLIDVGFEREEGNRIDPSVMQEEDWRPLRRLAQLGIAPETIDTVILSHAHYDHLSSCIDYYPKATFYIQEREIRYTLNPTHPWFSLFNVRSAVEKLVTTYRDRVRILNGDADIHTDLRVIYTGGHSPGHQSVIAQTAFGRTGFAMDIAFLYRNLEEDIPVGLHCNIEEVYLGMRRLRDECERVLPSHDPKLEHEFPIEQWSATQPPAMA